MESREPDPDLMRLSHALAEMRDSWVKMGMTLRDIAFELDSGQRDEVTTEVERYLARLRESGHRRFK